MLRRLLIGLVLGVIVGGLAAAALVAGLHIPLFGTDTASVILAYAAAAVTGVLTGLVAGKPIWASGAKIEAGLKAFFGALLASGLLFALRQWVHIHPDLAILMPGVALDDVKNAAIGQVPALALPAVAAVLGGFFELDNTDGPAKDDSKGGEAPKVKKRVDDKANGKNEQRIADDEEEGDADAIAPVASKRAKR